MRSACSRQEWWLGDSASPLQVVVEATAVLAYACLWLERRVALAVGCKHRYLLRRHLQLDLPRPLLPTWTILSLGLAP